MREPQRLRELLDNALKEFVENGEIRSDAIEPALNFSRWHDQELSAFLCGVLAYGRVEHIKKSIHRVLDPMGPAPHAWLLSARRNDIENLVAGWSHRFNTAEDMNTLLLFMRAFYRRHVSLEDFVLHGEAVEGVSVLLERFADRIHVLGSEESIKLPPASSSFWFFLPRPSAGSACKRMNLFLRWMAGCGPMDLNLWTRLSRKDLLIPLDVHVLRQARALKLTKRKQADWKTAEEVTAELRLLDPEDPTRFDFALCHLGIKGTVLKWPEIGPLKKN